MAANEHVGGWPPGKKIILCRKDERWRVYELVCMRDSDVDIVYLAGKSQLFQLLWYAHATLRNKTKWLSKRMRVILESEMGMTK